MSTSRAEAYAAALYAVASAEDSLARVGDELHVVASAIDDNDELRTTLSDAHLPAAKRQQIVEDLLSGKASDTTVALVGMVVGAGRVRELRSIVDEMLSMHAADQGREVAEVRSAIDLSEDQRRRLAAALERSTGSPVDVRVTVDPTVVGGMSVRVGDTVIDGTVRHRLQKLRESMTA